ncbi:MAG: inorganic pyrophosphatase [Deltaproteobacteria bacterium]|nr:inorganic pyrophosphatase [Deltaproteobacteria bacterium]
MRNPKSFSRWRPHPWHGLSPGPKPPEWVQAYVEMTPFDLVKYEVDKGSGYLRVDRPQRSSSQPPALYGFIPQTYCGDRVGALASPATNGDGDPLDICILSERPIARAEILVNAKVVGGLRMIDHGEADDKIVAVLENDNVWGQAKELSDLPPVLVERLRHYFTTYKLIPGQPSRVDVETIYGREDAYAVIRAALADYESSFRGKARRRGERPEEESP